MTIFKRIFQNTPAKIASLLISVAIWIYVGTGLAQIGNFPGSIPISVNNTPQGLVAVLEKESVDIKIVAAADIYKNLNADSFSASIDLNGFQAGTYTVSVTTKSNVAGVQIVEVSPQQVLVRLETVGSKEVPIVLLSQGKAADGFVVGDWKLAPARVKVSGATSVLDKILQVTVKITLNGEKETVSRILNPVALDQNGNEIRNLTFEPNDIVAEVPLVKASSAKTVGIKVNTTGQAAAGFWVSEIKTEPQAVTLTASPEIINGISFIETKEIDLNGLSANKEFVTTLKENPGITVLDNVSLVKVKVSVTKISPTPSVSPSAINNTPESQ